MKESRIERLTNRRQRRVNRRLTRNIKTSKHFNKFLQLTLGTWLEKTFNISVKNLELFQTVKPPYLVMSTHNSVFDPFIIADMVPEPISWVVSDAAFRKSFMGWALGLVGSIPKTKAMSDLGTIKNIMGIIKKAGVVGLFPEGQSPWDGHALPIVYSTAKLLKLLKVPVVFVHKQGVFFSMPRWAKSRRTGKVTLTFDLAFTADELKEMDADAIFKRLSRKFEHDEYDLQRRDMIRFSGEDRAEYLEIALFVCPHCREIASMESEGNDFFCKACGYRVHYNEFGFFEQKEQQLYFDSVRDWNVWQQEYLTGYLARRNGSDKDETIIRDGQIDSHVGYKTDPLESQGTGSLLLFKDKLVYEVDSEIWEFPLEEIQGANVHEDEKLEFYFRDSLFRFDSKEKRISLYKWFLCISILRKLTAA